MKEIKLCSIAAMAENRVIGRDNTLIWHIPEDLKHFKRTTMGKPLIMGRKSFESLPGILPGRPHIVISRSAPTPFSKDKESNPLSPDLHYVKSIEAGIEHGKALAEGAGVDEIFIAGGGEIYKQTLPLIERLYLTVVHRTYDGDTVFPEVNRDEWRTVHEEKHEAAGDLPAFTFLTLERKNI